MSYNDRYTVGKTYLVDGRPARYWGVNTNNNTRRILVFFDVKTDRCIEVSTKYLHRVKKLKK